MDDQFTGLFYEDVKIMAKRDNIEVLAPAGSYDILTAVISAGADAVYLGGDMFGARAFAGNFNKEELLRAIDYAHLRDRKIYLTVNTLLKEQELKERLTEYIAPFYEAGLDAAIVQDLGVFYTLKKNFPDLQLHASTQMTITGAEGARLLKEMGASRIVTARELDLSEISRIRKECDIEIESFVHGALCYCYSGQCLLSSMNGNRSGNRGRCAQPCRLGYAVIDNGRKINGNDNRYALSPKDMCALKILPEIIEAGVDSLKIEGRMKNVTYASYVTAIYRKYVDMYLEKGKSGYKVSQKDINDLMDIYNRGAFTTGYYDNDKGSKMMSLSRPNHMGTKALEVVENVNGRIRFKALTQIYPQDVFEIDTENSFSSGDYYSNGDIFVVNLPQKYNLPKGRVLNRTKNNDIAVKCRERYVNKEAKSGVNVFLYAASDEPLMLTLHTTDTTNAAVTVNGDIVQRAVKQPADKDKVAAQTGKLGDTPFVAEEINVELAGDVFIPVSQINDIRRLAVTKLEEAIVSGYRRNLHDFKQKTVADGQKEKPVTDNLSKSVLIRNIEQAKILLNEKCDIKTVYFDFAMYKDLADIEALGRIISDFKGRSVMVAGVLPHILRGKHTQKCIKLIENMNLSGIDAFLVRNLEELGILAKLVKDIEYKGSRKVIADCSLYNWNSMAVRQLIDITGKCGLELIRITYPYELSAKELAQVDLGGVMCELVVCSRIPLMVSEQCVRRTYGLCDKCDNTIDLKDKNGNINTVRSICDYCYTIIDSKRYNIINEELIKLVNPNSIRYEADMDCDCFKDMFCTAGTGAEFDGHFTMGVE